MAEGEAVAPAAEPGLIERENPMGTWTTLVKNATAGRCVVLVAASWSSGPPWNRKSGWNHYRLGDWQDTWQQKEKDPDGFSVYDLKTGVMQEVTFEGVKSKVWRIHDGTWVDVVDKDGNLVLVHQAGKKPNRSTGTWPSNKEGGLSPDDYDFPSRIDPNAK